MIAKIRESNNEIYCTNVLAVKWNGWSSKVIVFDKSKTNIICLDMWFPHRCFFVIDSETKDWTSNRKWKGYDWLVGDKNAMKMLVGGFLRKGRKLAIGDLMVSLPLAEEPNVPEWNDLKTKQNIESLLDVSMDFHDAVIENIEKTDTSLIVDFDTTWGCRILLRCSNIVDFNLDNLAQILYSEIEIIDSIVHWNVVCGEPSLVDDKKILSNWFIKSEKIEWKLIITENKH